MKNTSLAKTNQYLKDSQKRKRLVDRSVKTSCGVEGIKINLATVLEIAIPRRPKRIYSDVKK